jgi:hypothetical protein
MVQHSVDYPVQMGIVAINDDAEIIGVSGQNLFYYRFVLYASLPLSHLLDAADQGKPCTWV